MAYYRALSSAAIAALCCIAVFAVVNYTEVSIKLSQEPEEEPKVDVLKNLIDLKAYCLAAYDNTNIVMQNHPNLQAMAEFVHAYGLNGGGDDVGGRKAEVDNIVTEYAHVMGALKAKYGHGVNMYILDHLDKSLRHDPEGAVFQQLQMQALGGGGSKGHKYGQLTGLKYQSLGLEDMPNILVELAAKYAKFLTFKAHVQEQASNADVVAATMFLQSKSFGHYQSFLQREIAKVEKKMRSEFNFVAKAAFDAEEQAFQESYAANREAFFDHVAKQAPAAVSASDEAALQFPWTPPTMEELKAQAHNASLAFMKEFQDQHADPSTLLRRITEEAGGVKIFVSTTGATDAQSTMKPSITFEGAQGSMTHELRAVPGQGKTFVQHIPAKEALGKIQKIIITGTGEGLRWNCAGVKLRAGGVDEHIISFTTGAPQESFWLESGQSVDLLPNEVADEPKPGEDCHGWKGTSQCSGDGSRDKTGDKTCGESVDSTMSGYCDCVSGHKAVVDCGHDTFTCDEICGM